MFAVFAAFPFSDLSPASSVCLLLFVVFFLFFAASFAFTVASRFSVLVYSNMFELIFFCFAF